MKSGHTAGSGGSNGLAVKSYTRETGKRSPRRQTAGHDNARTEREIRQTNQTRTRTQQPQVQNKRYTKTPPRAAQGSGKRKKEEVHLVLCSSVQFSTSNEEETPRFAGWALRR